MYWELTMLNKLYKSVEFNKVKAKVHKDRIVFVQTENIKTPNVLNKLQKNENAVTEE
jgi:hypothetical protein